MHPPLLTTTFLLSLSLLLPLTTSTTTTPAIHLPLSRRNGSFLSSSSIANLTSLTQTLHETSTRFLATERRVADSHVIRIPRRHYSNILYPPGTTPLEPSAFLLGEVGREGGWFVSMQLGEGEREVEMDLGFLSGDFVFVDTGGEGSTGFIEGKILGLRGCRRVEDILRIGERGIGVEVEFAVCRPSRSWVGGLGRSGGLIGLAGGEGLRQVGGKGNGFLGELQRAGVLDERGGGGGVWSVVLINGREGVWSIGGTAEEIVREIEEEIEGELERLEGDDGLKREEKAVSDGDRWEWVRVQGTDGWWQIMMKSIYVSGTKVLQNQQVILDLNTPFIIGPPSAVRTLYASISGARALPPPYSHFYTYPCFNPSEIHFEFGSFRTAVMKGAGDKGAFSPGGRFSLGRAERGSGFCVGMVVEGVFAELGEGNGMQDVWVLGEPFFRDVQVAFDVCSFVYGWLILVSDDLVEGEESRNAESLTL
ncbi:Aspartic-type endopeptidase ctsD protein [Rutstroemia sp. NJR-2017a WRK4]|nr:Aspartic-type endopeptidase ctsD protein [Rutstroemia sp. NJR-2017a WRK4]